MCCDLLHLHCLLNISRVFNYRWGEFTFKTTLLTTKNIKFEIVFPIMRLLQVTDTIFLNNLQVRYELAWMWLLPSCLCCTVTSFGRTSVLNVVKMLLFFHMVMCVQSVCDASFLGFQGFLPSHLFLTSVRWWQIERQQWENLFSLIVVKT